MAKNYMHGNKCLFLKNGQLPTFQLELPMSDLFSYEKYVL